MSINQLVASLKAVVLASESPDDVRVKQLQRALQEQGDASVDSLAGALRDPEVRVSEAAADVLQAISSDRADEVLVRYALGQLADPTGRTKIPGPGWRRLQALGKRALKFLIRAYGPDQPLQTRLSMIDLVRQIADPDGLLLLETALAEDDSRVVQVAAEALGRIGSPDAFERLLELLGSENVQHRLGAIQGLQELGNSAAVEPLLGLLLAEDEPYAVWWPSPTAGPHTIHHAARQAIDALTAADFDGDVPRIRAWVQRHSPS